MMTNSVRTSIQSIKVSLVVLCFCGLFLGLSAQSPTSLPEDFNDELLSDNWDRPVGVTFAANGLGFVWEKKGVVWTLDEDGHKSAEPLIDITEEVLNWSDLGLVGFAVDPAFTENGYFYLFYVVDRHYQDFFGTPDYDPGFSQERVASLGRITRYTADAASGFTTADPATRHIVFGEDWADGIAILLPSHSVGSLVFGQDGTLLASLGDGGSYESIDRGDTPPTETFWAEAIELGGLSPEDNVGSLKALQIENLHGSIIRIDPVTGAGISSNPFYDASDPYAPESRIWVTGFRNPYRFILKPGTGSHDPADGDPGVLMIGDVGGSGWEELNIATQGGQCFGWPMFEGIDFHWGFKNQPKENPYAPNPSGCSETGFFNFEDLIKQPILNGTPPFPIPCNPARPIPDDVNTFVHTPPAFTWSGIFWNPPPKTRVPRFDEMTGELRSIDVGVEGSPVIGEEFPGFTSIPSFFYDQEVFPEAYQGKFFQSDLSGWIRTLTFDDNMEVIQVDTFAKWEDKGVVHVTLNPFDGAIYWCHFYNGELHKISYGGNPRPVVEATAIPDFGSSPLTVQLDAGDSFDPDGTPLTYHWDFGDGTTSNEVSPAHEFVAAGAGAESFNILLTVTDELGASSTEDLLVSLNNSPPAVAINSIRDGYRYANNNITILPLAADVDDAEHSGGELIYKWETFLHHNDHYHPNGPVAELTSSLLIDPLGCGQEAFWYRVRLTVTDAGGLSSFDEREIYPNCDAPFFEVSNLSARSNNGIVRLDWSSVFEEETTWFEIQRSADFNFATIGQVRATGSGDVYEYIDNSPLQGLNYYRLLGLNAAGEELYSNTAVVELNDRPEITVFPNPVVEEQLNIWIQELTDPLIELEIISPGGYIFFTDRWDGTIGQAFEERILLRNLPAGFYFYRLKNGETVHNSSFIKAY